MDSEAGGCPVGITIEPDFQIMTVMRRAIEIHTKLN